MMILFWNFRWLLLHFIFGHLHLHYVKATWPSSNSSKIQLLGLFQDADNSSITTEISIHSRAMFRAAVILSQQYNITVNGQFLGWQEGQTGGNMIDALKDTCQALSVANIVGIVGPTLSREAHLIAAFGTTVDIPVISYAATDPDLSDRNAYPTFYRTVPSDSAAAVAIVNLFLKFNWTACIIIYQNDEYGSGGSKAISDAFTKNNLIVAQTVIFDIAAGSIQGNLQTYLMESAARIVLLWTESDYIPSILQTALDSNVLGPEFVWILTSAVPLNQFNATFRQQLIGMLTIEPDIGSDVNVPTNTTLLNAAYNIWQQYEPQSFPGSTQVNKYALFAFDATWSLILSLQKLCSTPVNSSSTCLSFIASSSCFDPYFVQSDLLLNTISTTPFLGVSGPIQFSMNVSDRINSSYYYIQNAQSFSNGLAFVPVLVYTDFSNWTGYTGANTIIWPGNSLVKPGSIPLLRGVTLKVGVIDSPPFTNVISASGQTTPQYTGYVPDLITLLQNNVGFYSNLQLAPANKTYDELIQLVVNGDYDVLVGDITITSTRRELVGFSQGMFDNALRIMMRKTPDISVDLFGFTGPFSRNLWLLTLGVFIYAGGVFCLLERDENEALQNRSILSQFAMSVWFSFGNIVGYGVEYGVSTGPGRLLTVGLYVVSLILVASYTANLASNLTIAKSTDVIAGIDDIKNGKIPFNRIGIVVGSASEDYFLTEVSHGMRDYYQLYSTQEGYDSLLANIIDATFTDSGIGEYVTDNIYCNLTLVGQSFNDGQYGIVTPKNWLYAQDLDVNILLLSEGGDLDTLTQKWFQGTNCPASSGTTTSMGIPQLGGLIITFAVISALSLLLFAWKKRNNINKNCFTSVCQKKPSNKRNNSVREQSIKSPELVQNF